MTEVNDRSGIDVEYDPDSDRYLGSFDEQQTEASVAVVDAIAAVHHSDPMDLEPLYDSVDTDALDSLIANTDRRSATVAFDVDELRVTVGCNGTIEIEPPRLDGAE